MDEPPHKAEDRGDADRRAGGGLPAHSAGKTLAFGFRGLCPRCGTGQLFTRYLTITERCDVCGLGFGGHDVGDGPVVPMILVVGGLVVGLAWMIEVAFQPPLWVHAVLWGPLILALCLGMLPILKGISVALQFRLRATDEETKPGGG